MPNECTNHITITSIVESDITNIYTFEIPSLYEVTIHKRGKNGIRFTTITGWSPDYQWIESLIKKYPMCWVKNEWISEDGSAGIWVGDSTKNSAYEWIDLSIEDEFFLFR
jgi:hypothetical protein